MKTKEVGQWVSVSEFAACMNISVSYVHVLRRKGKITMKKVTELDDEGYAQFGRGSGTCIWAVWLPDEMQSICVGAGRRSYNVNRRD